MPAPWKVVLIGGEITVLAAFTGLGVHLAIQPHRHALVAPPPLLLPVAPAPAPAVTASGVAPPPAKAAATPVAPGLSGDWISQLGRHDRSLAKSQWDILEGLIGGVERYLRERVVPQLEQRG